MVIVLSFFIVLHFEQPDKIDMKTIGIIVYTEAMNNYTSYC